jgi:hypothetical protein
METGPFIRLAPLVLAGVLVASLARWVAIVADRTRWHAERIDAWDSAFDDDPEPDAETLEAHARLVIANRVASGR